MKRISTFCYLYPGTILLTIIVMGDSTRLTEQVKLLKVTIKQSLFIVIGCFFQFECTLYV